jgi:hypothetical protein
MEKSKEQLKTNGLRQATEQAKRDRAENNLLRVLLAIVINEIGGGEGDHWRVIFSPKRIEFGKRLALKIDAGRQALNISDIQEMIQQHLKIEVPPFGLSEELEKLLPPDQIKKTFVAEVSYASDPVWLREKAPDPIKVVTETFKEVSETPGFLVTDVAPSSGAAEPLPSSPAIIFDSDHVGILPEGKAIQIQESDGSLVVVEKDGLPSNRGRRRYCEQCEEFVLLGDEHLCRPI